MTYIDIILDMINRTDEEEWFDFKVNWFNPIEIGEYISAISNATAVCGKKEGYMVWGIENGTHKILGTNLNYNVEYKNNYIFFVLMVV